MNMMGRTPVGQLFHIFILVTVIYISSGIRIHIECNGTASSKQFDRIFNIGIVVDGNPVVKIEDKTPIIVPDSGVTVIDISGTVSKDATYLQAELDMDCLRIDKTQCVIFGLPNDREKFSSADFNPSITFDVDVTNIKTSKQPHKDQYSIGEVVQIQCSADVGSNTTEWQFKYSLHGFEGDVEDNSKVTTISRSHCIYHARSAINFTITKTGNVQISCFIGEYQIGKVSLEVLDIEAILSNQLFLSSIFLVYLPFIIMPSLWCSCPACTRSWRNPDHTLFKSLRSFISLSDGLLFLGWWVTVGAMYGQRQEFASYATFAYIEGAFIFLYALFRCLFKFLESPESWVGPKRAYNGRVATSYGAVITPVICWLMIRIPKSLSWIPLESVFWALAVLSLVAFMYVSHLREGKHWNKQE